MSELVQKVSTRLYFLRQLEKWHVATRELLLFYTTCICSTLEYSSQVFHCALPSYLSEDLERLQKRAMKIIYPELSYAIRLWSCLDFQQCITITITITIIYLTTLTSKSTKCSFKIRTCIKLSKIHIHMKY